MTVALMGLGPSSLRLPPSGKSYSVTAVANAKATVILPSRSSGSVIDGRLIVKPYIDAGLADPLLQYQCIDWYFAYQPALSSELQYKIEKLSGDTPNYGSYVLATWTAFTGANVECGYQVNAASGAAMSRSGTLRVSLRFGTSSQVLSSDLTLTVTRSS